jgi:hypothetical protein
VKPVGFGAIRANPRGCCRRLKKSGAVSYFEAEVMTHTAGITILEVEFVAPKELPSYPVERVRISVLSDASIAAVPIDCRDRRWYHRFPRWSTTQIVNHGGRSLPWPSVVGGLCLWYPRDPRAWRWTWDDGFDTYLLLVQRHLWAEEYFRRHGCWPVNDAPHGERSDGYPHPLPLALRECA